MTVPDHRAYYESLVASWRGPVQVELLDSAAFVTAPLEWIDRLRFRAQIAMPRGATLATRVTLLDDTHVRHETRLLIAGLPAFDGDETIALLPDGHSITLRGQHRFFPDVWRTRTVEGVGRVDGAEARYELSWLGLTIRQHATASPDRQQVVLVQESAFLRTTQVLGRLG